MPKYFFNVCDGFSINDRDGTDLPDVHEARRIALRRAMFLLDEEEIQERLGEDWRIEVTDEAGANLFRLDFFVTKPVAL